MPDFLHALQSGSTSLWLFIPTAILLGAMHGLEPGHSKTMMAAFIVAIRGTVWQAVLLGLSAAISHSLIIWVLAAAALYFGSQWNAESVEPYLQIGSAVCILALALWMFLRTRRELREAHHHHHGHGHHHHDHAHEHDGGHEHDDSFLLHTGHGKIELSVFENGVPPVFRLRAPAGETLPEAANVIVETVRPGDVRQTFAFTAKDGFLESRDDIPEPHEFGVVLTLTVGGERHTARTEFREAHEHTHGKGAEFQDAHELEHATDIRQRFAGRAVTTPQIMLFGVTGGIMLAPPRSASCSFACNSNASRSASRWSHRSVSASHSRWSRPACSPRGACSTRKSDSKVSVRRCAAHLTSRARCLSPSPPTWHGWKTLPAR